MKKVIFFIIIAYLILLTGCWDKRELNEIGIVIAIGLDKDISTGKFNVTYQIVNPSGLSKDGGQNPPIELIASTGDSILEAFRKITKEFDRIGYFAQTKLIVISENIAKEGIIPYIGFFHKSVEIRPLTYIVIAKDNNILNIMGTSHGIEKIQAIYLTNLIKENMSLSEGVDVNILDVSKKISSGGINPVVGVMTNSDSHPNLPSEEKQSSSEIGVHFSGCAVFKNDKLVGYLNDKDTRWLNCIINKMGSAVINVPIQSMDNKNIVVEVSDSSCNIIPEKKGDSFIFNINIKLKGNIVEQQAYLDTSNVDIFNDLEKNLVQVIEQEVNQTIETVQNDQKSDVFGFGNALNRKYPDEWKVIEKNWDNIFEEVEYKVVVDAKLRRTGATSKPLEFK